MGGLFSIGGNNAGQQNQSISDLFSLGSTTKNIGTSGVATGAQTTSQGLSGLTGAQSYFQQLASGNRSALMQAVAPSVNAANSQQDAQRKQQASMGTARGGGVAATNQQADTAKNATIDNLLFGAQSQGAQGEASTGSAIAGVGQSQGAQGLQALNESIGAEEGGGSIATNARSEALKGQQTLINMLMGKPTSG